MPPLRLVDRAPTINAAELIDAMVPPRQFEQVRFDNYLPDPHEPSQQAAVDVLQQFAAQISAARRRTRSLFGSRRPDSANPGCYLDGGFGVGKTHLLASLWHAVPGPKAYASFVELTSAVGVLGFSAAVQRLSGHRLLAIDEFELDDPGDTMLITRLLTELTSAGVFVAATSNTLPEKLGEGRFAAADFLREIQGLAARFDVIRINGPDYRHRGMPQAPSPLSDAELITSAAHTSGATLDDFDELCVHLAQLHPSKYGHLVQDLTAVHLRNVHAASDENVALRLVAFADRLYDRNVPVLVSGQPLSEMFTEDMLRGGYRKKYLRALSRLIALCQRTPAASSAWHSD